MVHRTQRVQQDNTSPFAAALFATRDDDEDEEDLSFQLRECNRRGHRRTLAEFTDNAGVLHDRCNACRQQDRDAHQRRRAVAQATALDAQLAPQLEQQALLQAQPRGPHPLTPEGLNAKSMNPAEEARNAHWRAEMLKKQLEDCNHCNERWFELVLNPQGKCHKCKSSEKWTMINKMDPSMFLSQTSR